MSGIEKRRNMSDLSTADMHFRDHNVSKSSKRNPKEDCCVSFVKLFDGFCNMSFNYCGFCGKKIGHLKR